MWFNRYDVFIPEHFYNLKICGERCQVVSGASALQSALH